jgi:hypothetical protein
VLTAQKHESTHQEIVLLLQQQEQLSLNRKENRKEATTKKAKDTFSTAYY